MPGPAFNSGLFHAQAEVIMSLQLTCLYLRIHPMCKLSCVFLKKHVIVFTCSYPLPVSFPCVYLSFFPHMSPGNSLRVHTIHSTSVNSVSISRHFKVAVRENVTGRQHFFIPSSCGYGKSNLGDYPGPGCK